MKIDFSNIMRTVIVSSEVEFKECVSKEEKEGFMAGAVSNAGLPPGKFRITFLPKSAFEQQEEK